jgi:hypothetical protein
MSEESVRTPVQVGIDLRPVPLALSDGTVWNFNPDPDTSFFAKSQQLATQMQAEDGAEHMEQIINEMRTALADQIVDKAERDKFVKRGYGMAVLGALSAAYAEQVVALPTESSKPSGRAQQRRGGNR